MNIAMIMSFRVGEKVCTISRACMFRILHVWTYVCDIEGFFMIMYNSCV